MISLNVAFHVYDRSINCDSFVLICIETGKTSMFDENAHVKCSLMMFATPVIQNCVTSTAEHPLQAHSVTIHNLKGVKINERTCRYSLYRIGAFTYMSSFQSRLSLPMAPPKSEHGRFAHPFSFSTDFLMNIITIFDLKHDGYISGLSQLESDMLTKKFVLQVYLSTQDDGRQLIALPYKNMSLCSKHSCSGESAILYTGIENTPKYERGCTTTASFLITFSTSIPSYLLCYTTYTFLGIKVFTSIALSLSETWQLERKGRVDKYRLADNIRSSQKAQKARL